MTQQQEIAQLKAELARPESTIVSIMRAEIASLKAELAKPAQQERNPAWTPAQLTQEQLAPINAIGPTPAWHDAPTVPGLWYSTKSERVWNFHSEKSIQVNGGYVGRWYGPIPYDS